MSRLGRAARFKPIIGKYLIPRPVALSGNVDIGISPAASLTTAIQASGSATATLTPTATLTASIKFVGSTAITVSPTAVLSTGIPLAGSATVTISPTAGLTSAIKLATSTSVLTVTPSADLTTVAGHPVHKLTQGRHGLGTRRAGSFAGKPVASIEISISDAIV